MGTLAKDPFFMTFKLDLYYLMHIMVAQGGNLIYRSEKRDD